MTPWCAVQSGWEMTAVNAKQMISGASYGPDALKAIGQAFDEAWIQIAGNFGNDPGDIEKVTRSDSMRSVPPAWAQPLRPDVGAFSLAPREFTTRVASAPASSARDRG